MYKVAESSLQFAVQHLHGANTKSINDDFIKISGGSLEKFMQTFPKTLLLFNEGNKNRDWEDHTFLKVQKIVKMLLKIWWEESIQAKIVYTKATLNGKVKLTVILYKFVVKQKKALFNCT